ncbi:MAG: two-component system, cell cycle response regulator [Actinomycetota bacterium]|jgi:two-component system cell cycle response regulator|nr:Response regulator pleD [Cryptosporangiaceae bacterium]MDQ1676559.1 two-component system, cell cycle response regulator [Actinomycetota bacterium]
MSTAGRATRPELVPLASRIRWTVAFRVVLILLPPLMWQLLPGARSGEWASLGFAAAGYLAFLLITLPLPRLGRPVALTMFLASLLVDGIYLAWAFHLLNGLAGPVGYLVTLHIVAVTLLVSFRSGLRLALWHSLLAFAVLQAEAAQVLGLTMTPVFPVEGFATYLGVLWITALATATFAAVNERELRRRRYDTEVLRRFAQALEAIDDPARILAALAGLARQELLATRVAVLARPQGDASVPGVSGVLGTVVTLAGDGVPLFVDAPDELAPGSLVAQALATREPVLSTRVNPGADDWLLDLLPGLHHVVVVPFALNDQLDGALVFEYGPVKGLGRTASVERRLLATAQQAAAQATMALGRALLLQRLRTAAETDGLTKVANRRMFDVTLEREAAQTRRTGGSFAVALVDLDFFKSLNDEHGHLVGDDVLRGTAQAIRETCRDGDLAARYGGEEFAVIFTHVTADQAAVAAERVRSAIQRADVSVPVTASIGVATFPDHADDPRELLALADESLYLAKSAGRNRVVVAGLDGEKPRMVPRPRASEPRPADRSH